MSTSVHVDQRALDGLVARFGLPAALHVGNLVADVAATHAPERTGAGAASIHAEEVDGEIRVSWSPEHFYMFFHEVGTSRMSARPFLRPALDAHYTL